MVCESAVTDAEDVDGVEVDLPAGSGHAEEVAGVSTVIGLEGRDLVVFDRLPMNFGMEVREGGAERR